MSDVFCPLPWIGYSIRSNGIVRICCHANQGPNKGILLKEDDTSFKYNDIIDESRNSKTLKSVRLSILNGKWHPECVRCMREFNSGLKTRNRNETSLLQKYFTEENARELTKSDGTINTSKISLRYLDLRFGNTCNLRCRTCGPTDSSGWFKEYEDAYGTNTYDEYNGTVEKIKIIKEGGKYIAEGKPYDWYKESVFWKDLSKYKDSIKSVYIVGGEPLIIYEHYDFLDECVKGGYSNDMIVEYNTNLTVIPEKAIAVWKNFGEVKFGVSIDGVGKVNDYIRWPSKFSTIEKNLKLLDEAEANYTLWTAYTVSVYNLLHLPEFIIWKIRQKFKRVNSSQCDPFTSTHPVHRPDHMNVKIFPKGSADIIEKRLRGSFQRVADELTKSSTLNLEQSMKIYSDIIEGYIKYMNQEDYSKFIPKFWSVNNKIDEIRGCKLKDYIPEIIDLLPMRSL